MNESKFMIHFKTAFYSFELYNRRGNYCFTLEEAKEEAIRQYPDESFEVYNGSEAYTHDWE